jgi:hypothetical protein
MPMTCCAPASVGRRNGDVASTRVSGSWRALPGHGGNVDRENDG